MANPTQICVFNPTTNLVDVAFAAVIGPGVPGAPVALNSGGVIDPTLLQLGTVATTGESLSSGNLVNLYSSSGVLKVQLAYAGTAGTPPSGGTYPVLAAGFVSQTVGISSQVTVAFSGIFYYHDTHSEFSASDIGAEVYLSPIDKGGITKTRPSSPPTPADQSVGYVLSYNSLNATVGVAFAAGFNDFSHISGVAQIGQGGTGADLSATGGTSQVLKQTSAGGNITVAQLAASDISGTTQISHGGTSATTGAQALINLIAGSPITGQALVWSGSAWMPGSAVTPFSDLTSGINTSATMTVGPGAVLTFSGSGSPPSEGEINANFLYGVQVSGAPTIRQVLVYNGSSWAPAAVVNSFIGRTGAVVAVSGDYSAGQITGLAASATTDTTNASNITTGTLPAAQLPAVPKPLYIFAPGVGTNNQILFRGPLGIAMTFPINASLSYATAGTAATGSVSPPVISVTFTFSKNGTPFATCVFGEGSPPAAETGTYTQASAVSFTASDILEVDGPATADATLANVCLTFVGNG